MSPNDLCATAAAHKNLSRLQVWHGRGQGQGQAVAQGLRCLIQTFEFTLKPHKNARAKRNENNRYEVHSQWSAGRGKEGECRIGIFILT